MVDVDGGSTWCVLAEKLEVIDVGIVRWTRSMVG